MFLFFAFILVSGCMMGPNYQRPEVDTPQTWRFEDKEAKDVVNTAWWEQFNDPVLNELINIALQENKDVKIAAAVIEEFMGRYGVVRAPLYPQIGAGAIVGRDRATEEGPAPVSSAVENPANNYQVFLNASWEIDLWGKLRRATEAARADLLSTEEAKRTVILSLVTSVAGAYINLRDLDKQLEIAKQTAKAREDSYKLFKLRFEGGVISELELNQVKSEYEQALSTFLCLRKLSSSRKMLCHFCLAAIPAPFNAARQLMSLFFRPSLQACLLIFL